VVYVKIKGQLGGLCENWSLKRCCVRVFDAENESKLTADERTQPMYQLPYCHCHMQRVSKHLVAVCCMCKLVR